MTTATPNEPASADDNTSRTRLDKEIEEILARSGADRLKEPRRIAERPKLRSMPGGLTPNRPSTSSRLTSGGLWMIAALVVALIAVLVSDASPLLARLFVFAAVACFLAPIVSRFWKPASPPEQKMWRGQVMEVTPERTNPIDQLRQWWQDRTRR